MVSNELICLCVRDTIPREPPMSTSIDTITFGCQLASTYLALDFWGSQNRNKMLICQCQGVSVGSGLFAIFRVFRKKFPRGPGDGFCDFVCFRTSKISSYFRELNGSGVEVYKSPGCFAALRRYPCLRVQSSNTAIACSASYIACSASYIACLASYIANTKYSNPRRFDGDVSSVPRHS